MKSFVAAALFIAGILAAPSSNVKAIRSPLCPSGLKSNPQCCSTDVLGIADLDCANPLSLMPSLSRPFAQLEANGLVAVLSQLLAKRCFVRALSAFNHNRTTSNNSLYLYRQRTPLARIGTQSIES
ncbi:hypothetical protein TrVFT333_007544 [Trichoderma virens FT-333]|nr:hypothetical protein TrVFT333_007544 [Trichoderma virens FT-333]